MKMRIMERLEMQEIRGTSSVTKTFASQIVGGKYEKETQNHNGLKPVIRRQTWSSCI